jgi:glycosyltransferase involved in cell wall biosynthesis
MPPAPAPDRQTGRSLSAGGRPVVLQVLPSLLTGGAERGAIDVAIALARAGGTPIVASSGGPMERELARAGISHVTLPLASKNPLVIRANVRRLEALIRERRVDIVHARSRAPAWSAYAACRRTRTPFTTTVHAAYPITNPLKKLYNAVMVRGRPVIAISEFVATHVVETYGVDPANIRMIPRGIDLARFSPEAVGAERVVQRAAAWRLPDGVPIVLAPGRLSRIKGHAPLIKALAWLGRHDIRCLLVGADQGRARYRRELDALIARHNLEDVVHIAGHCDDMPAAYKLADVVVAPSVHPEGFGRTIVEAQAMGRPLIATSHGATAETVLPDGVTGWLVPPGDVEALAGALETALGLSREEREGLARRAIAHVRARYDLARMTSATLDVYAEMLGIAIGSEGEDDDAALCAS